MIKHYPHLETERQDSVLIVRLANEAARNSLTREIRFSLREVTREIQDDYSIRAVYLTGKGPTFCAGGDLRMLTESKGAFEKHRRFRHAATFMPQLMTLDRPVVCGVRGVAIGGGMGLALMADSTCNRFAMLEAVAMGVRNGLELQVMTDVLNAGGARSKATENMLPAMVRGEPDAYFQLALMLKDLNLAAGLATETGVPLQFGQMARAMLQAASNILGPKANLFDITDYVAAEAGIRFRPDDSA